MRDSKMTFVRVGLAAVGVLALSCTALRAQSTETPRVTFGAFVDAYFAFDAGAPPTFDRAFTTQAVRANEFNVNLAFVEALLAGEKVRGRFAVQAGTSVQSNYAGEPAVGANSGPSLARNIQEAFVGYRVGERLWVDGGIFYSNMGMESWVSSDNLTYTRSLVADFSPFYSSGVRATWQASERLTARVDLVNGWQNISETNTDKSVGTRLDFAPRPGVTLSHYLYGGTETGGRVRLFTGVGAIAELSSQLKVEAQVDVGRQGQGSGSSDADSWTGGVLAARWALRPTVSLVGRAEWYNDPAQVIVVTGVADPFKAAGGSIGLEVSPGEGFLWRTELRTLSADAELFPDRDAAGGLSKSNLVLVTAFTMRR